MKVKVLGVDVGVTVAVEVEASPQMMLTVWVVSGFTSVKLPVSTTL